MNIQNQSQIDLNDIVKLLIDSPNLLADKFLKILPVTIYLIDGDDYTIQYVNRDVSKFTGTDYFAGMHYLDLMDKVVHPDDLRKIKIAVSRQKELIPGHFYNSHYRINTVYGEIWVQDRSTLFINPSDHKRLIIGSIMDISHLMKDMLLSKKSARQLRIDSRFKDQFISIITHDIKGAFSGYLNMSGLLSRSVGDLSVNEIRSMSNDLHISADNLFKLLDNLMDWSKIQKDTSGFNPTIVDLGELAEINVELYKPLANSKKITLTSSVPKNLFSMVDNNFINTLFRNLLSNALKFTHADGFVHISHINTLDGFHLLKFEDSGIGMDDILLEKIFNSDQTVTTLGTLNEAGTGLGLTVVRDIIRKSGGRLEIESIPGKGTNFFVYLPIEEHL